MVLYRVTKAIALASAILVGVNAEKCTALAMSGGGSKGAYEAGGLWGLYYSDVNATADKYAYDVMTGVSAGALNTACGAMFEPSDVEHFINYLSEKWQELKEDNVWVPWKPAGIITGINKKSGVLDTSALFKFVQSVWDELGGVVKRKIVVSCVDASSGATHLFNETSENVIKGVVSSASIPFVFPHQIWEPNTYDNPTEKNLVCMDGGTVYNTNLVSAVERCRETADKDEDITVDIVICSYLPELGSWDDRDDALSNFLRFKEIRDYYDGIADVYKFKQGFPNVNFRYFVQPSEAIASGLGILNFNNETMTYPMQMLGRLDGENAIKTGEGFYFKAMDEWRDSPELQKDFPHIGHYINHHI